VHDYLDKWRKKIAQLIYNQVDARKFSIPAIRSLCDGFSRRIHSSLLKMYAMNFKKPAKRSHRSPQLTFAERYEPSIWEAQIVPELTDAHQEARIKFCRTFVKKKKLSGIFFSDETYIELGSGDRGLWYKTGNRPKRGKTKFVTLLMLGSNLMPSKIAIDSY